MNLVGATTILKTPGVLGCPRRAFSDGASTTRPCSTNTLESKRPRAAEHGLRMGSSTD